MDESEKRKQVRFREPPSVPFLWELRPGTPKKDWKPEPPSSSSSCFSSSAAASVSQVPKPPIKLIASVPFAWEEKPGTPIPHFSLYPETELVDMESSSSSSSSTSSATVAAASVSQVPKPPIKLVASIPFAWEEKPGTPIPHVSLNSEAKFIDLASPSSSSSSSAYHVACRERSCDSSFAECSDTDMYDSVISIEPESFGCSDPSLPASDKLSSEIPLQKSSLSEHHCEQIVESSCSSPASENGSSTSSYETGRSSLVGASFLESLFPLFPPNTGFLEKTGSSSTPLELKESRDFDGEEDNSTAMLRKPPTLGELIMMSRRRSCRRKAVQMGNRDLQRSIRKKEAFGCFMFASSCKMIEGLFDKKFLPRLKLV
ncbi:NADPH oxidase activator isoform X3 [Neltuma alba]|uniref:NADPH oxidase activator isoform X3 n=1 Tax=Neltuma alba TaxID=207710 RepID=UPI0010A3EC08|nr:NADPH oxidase activator isoform X3 [Prosopis alba]